MKKAAVFLAIAILVFSAVLSYWIFNSSNIAAEKRVTLKIPTGSQYNDVLAILKQNNVLKNEFPFTIMSQLKHYPQQIKPGYYTFSNGMNNRQIINMLRAGLQTPVTLVIYNIRTKEEFASLVGRTMELDSTMLLKKLNDEKFCSLLNSDTNNVLSHFIVDNYSFYWNTSLDIFLDKMKTAYNNFWTDERKAKAAALHLTPEEATTLASIVEKEVIRDKELPVVAGVYLNRLKIGMPLQADPTLVFAMRDFDAQRITSRHKEFDTPFNTYKYGGLPPGLICMPRKKSIDAVLNFEQHNYLYFVANPDLSGYSIFSKTYQEQMHNAALYQKKLNQLNIH
jgi:UPF0755 protein